VDERAHIWDVRAGKQVASVGALRGLRAALSRDGRSLVVGTSELDLWDVAEGRNVARLSDDRSTAYALAFSPDGGLLACASYSYKTRGRELLVRETISGARAVAIDVEPARTVCLAISPDGRILANGEVSGAVRLWDLWSGELRHSFQGHTGMVFDLAFNSDGSRLVSGSQDGTALIWKVPPAAARPRPKVETKLDELWDALAGAPDKAIPAVRRLVETPGPAEALLRKHLAELRAGKEEAGTKLDRESAADRRTARALQALEVLGTEEAGKLLRELGTGAEGAWQTTRAKEALGRLAQRAGKPTP
jgi:hypothetical protein